MVSANEGDEGGAGDLVVVESQSRHIGEEIVVCEESVGAVENLACFVMHLMAG